MRKILLIEDDPETRENIAEILNLANYEVVTAENGTIGVELTKKEKPELIICDIMMQGLDGYGVLMALSKDSSTAGIPFIFLTAKADNTDMRKGMSMGADDYLTKPIRETDLLNAIKVRLNRVDFFKKSYSRDIKGLVDFMNEVKKFSLPNINNPDFRVQVYREKDVLFREGDTPNGAYFINKGKVKLWKVSPDGKEFISDIYIAGDFLGHIPLLQNTNYTDTATVTEPAETAFIPKHNFLSIIYSEQEISAQFIKMLANDIAEKKDRLLALAYSSVRSRVADSLMKLYNKLPEKTPVHISREDLANLVGTSTESLIRTLSDFKREFIVELEGRDIKVLNSYKLDRIARSV